MNVEQILILQNVVVRFPRKAHEHRIIYRLHNEKCHRIDLSLSISPSPLIPAQMETLNALCSTCIHKNAFKYLWESFAIACMTAKGEKLITKYNK